MPAPFKHELNSERTEVTLEIDGKTVVLTTAELVNAILWLGQVRSQMQPPFPKEPDAETPVAKLSDWRVQPYADNPARTGAMLSVRSEHRPSGV